MNITAASISLSESNLLRVMDAEVMSSILLQFGTFFLDCQLACNLLVANVSFQMGQNKDLVSMVH